MEMPVKTILENGYNFLKTRLPEREAKSSSRQLLLHILDLNDFSDLVLKNDNTISFRQKNQYYALLNRRLHREPLQYLIGSVEFYNSTINVSDHCLIPRPETEILVEKALSWAKGKGILNILDVATGSGNIAISLKKELPASKVNAFDCFNETISVARKNAAMNNVQIRFLNQNILDSWELPNQYNLIVSNPPYLSEEEFEMLEPELRFEPKQALVAGETGLEMITQIIKESKKFLLPEGGLFIEIGYNQGEKTKNLFSEYGFKNIAVLKDYQQHDRIVFGEF